MFQNSVDVVIAVFKAFLKKKNANTSHYGRHYWKNTSFLFYAFFLSFYFVIFFALDSIEVGYSGVKFVGRNRGLFGGSMAFNIYH